MKKNVFITVVMALLSLTACKGNSGTNSQFQTPVDQNLEETLVAESDDFEDELAEAENGEDGIIGLQFLDLEEPDVNGEMHKLSEYVGKGQWVLIDFWASWCGPCRAEMPNVVAAYQKYHAKGFNIVGLSFDQDKEAWVNAISALNMPWVHLSDLNGWHSKAAQVYGVNSIPASLLVDPQGKIAAVNLRGEALGETLQKIYGE